MPVMRKLRARAAATRPRGAFPARQRTIRSPEPDHEQAPQEQHAAVHRGLRASGPAKKPWRAASNCARPSPSSSRSLANSLTTSMLE